MVNNSFNAAVFIMHRPKEFLYEMRAATDFAASIDRPVALADTRVGGVSSDAVPRCDRLNARLARRWWM